MAKWHAQPEYLELFTDKPPMLAGFCVVDEDGRYFETELPEGQACLWISLDRSAAEEFAAELNARESDG